MEPLPQPSYQTTLRNAVTALQRISTEGRSAALPFPSIEKAINAAQASDLAVLTELEAVAIQASMRTVDDLLARKGKSPTQFLSELSEAGQFKLSALLSAGAKLKEFQTDLPDLTQGAAAFLIARGVRMRIAELRASDLRAATI